MTSPYAHPGTPMTVPSSTEIDFVPGIATAVAPIGRPAREPYTTFAAIEAELTKMRDDGIARATVEHLVDRVWVIPCPPSARDGEDVTPLPPPWPDGTRVRFTAEARRSMDRRHGLTPLANPEAVFTIRNTDDDLNDVILTELDARYGTYWLEVVA